MICNYTLLCVCVCVFTQQCVRVLAAESRLLRCVRVFQECGVVDADVGMLGELPESERGVQVQLPTLLLSAATEILLTHIRTHKCITDGNVIVVF